MLIPLPFSPMLELIKCCPRQVISNPSVFMLLDSCRNGFYNENRGPSLSSEKKSLPNAQLKSFSKFSLQHVIVEIFFMFIVTGAIVAMDHNKFK
uniref:Uncharacterized protein n=1 Tax=Arundo donax TaxID=35708 RepID=A0A0A9DL40_ARUDO